MCAVTAQGITLKAGESLVAMSVLSPDLVQQVQAASAAASAPGEAAAGAPAAESSSGSEAAQQGPWLLLVTRLGTGKRVLLSDVPCKATRGIQGVIGIKLNAGVFLTGAWPRAVLVVRGQLVDGWLALGLSCVGQLVVKASGSTAAMRMNHRCGQQPLHTTPSSTRCFTLCHCPLFVCTAAGDSLAMAQIVHSDDDDVVLASKQGVVMRCAAKDVPQMLRPAKGCRLMSLQPEDEVQTLTILPAEYKTVLA